MTTKSFVLAFDTANEVIAIGLGKLDFAAHRVVPLKCKELAAHRASNVQLIPQIEELIAGNGIARTDIACVVCGRGPGSFTGVRICMATAKGIASALGVPLWGVSSLDAVAWQLWEQKYYGSVVVLADAMRKEIYPACYSLDEAGVCRLTKDCVVKADKAADLLVEAQRVYDGQALLSLRVEEGERFASTEAPSVNVAEGAAFDVVAGDGLTKYQEFFSCLGPLAPQEFWTPTGRGLLLALQDLWRSEDFDPCDITAGDPAVVLPVYTRLSDAEENERIRLAKNSSRNLRTGVQESEAGLRADQRRTMHDSAILNARANRQGLLYKPLDAEHVPDVVRLENKMMLHAWGEAALSDELTRKDRLWWAAYVSVSACETAGEYASTCEDIAAEGDPGATKPIAINIPDGLNLVLVGYAGCWVVDGRMEVLRIGVDPAFRQRGIARELMHYLACDARDLGAHDLSLEVAASNTGAQAFYERLGFSRIGVRRNYYGKGEDAVIMEGSLPLETRDVAGMSLQDSAGVVSSEAVSPRILAIETSCDETAAAIIDGSATLYADVVASQVDFHARFGGVVPEIASRKHIEAICGVIQECFSLSRERQGNISLSWRDIDAVAVTYTPGLVGALVVGLAFAKGLAWALEKPLIGINHLEGHIYANKLADADITPPFLVSLVSGGHTLLVHVKDWGDYETIGSTIDDAVGEAFDKVAKALGLGYPGGPVISKLAEKGDAQAIDFPRALLHSHDLRFSLSGLKTAVMTYINKERESGRALNLHDIAASFQQAVIDVQVAKVRMALLDTGIKTFCLGGGVAANPALRSAYEKMCTSLGVELVLPPLSACGDNAGMIALVALDRFKDHKFAELSLDVRAHTSLDEKY